MRYTNRKGDVYYLHRGTTRGGKLKWYMSSKHSEACDHALPEGYEIYEHPADAQVFVRKVPRQAVLDTEVELVRQIARTRAQTRYTLVDVRDRAIIVYSANEREMVSTMEIAARLGGRISPAATKVMEQQLRYHQMLQFVLFDPATREFWAHRWCFLGSIDDWFPLESGPLQAMAMKYLPHVGAESFFELM